MRALPARPRPVARVLPLTEPCSPPSRAASGWFRNIFDAKLVLDPTLYTLVADPHYNIEVKHFDGRGAISGKLVVAAPEGRTVDHEGIEISFSTIVDNKNDMQSTRGPAMLKTWTLLEPGEVTGAIEIPFDIDLTQIPQLRDSYDGEHIHLRHILSYRIVRPWYTFSVRGEEVVSVGLSHLPEVAVPSETTLLVNDCGCTVEFDHGKSVMTVDERLVRARVALPQRRALVISKAALHHRAPSRPFWPRRPAASSSARWAARR